MHQTKGLFTTERNGISKHQTIQIATHNKATEMNKKVKHTVNQNKKQKKDTSESKDSSSFISMLIPDSSSQ